MEISELRIHDDQAVAALWQAAGMPVEPTVRDAIASHLRHNPTLTLVAREGEQVVGLILCSRVDGRGAVSRLAVAASHQGQGLEKLLVDKALLKLNARGIHKCVLDTQSDPTLNTFWDGVRWDDKAELSGRHCVRKSV